MNQYSISGRVVYSAPNRFMATASACPSDRANDVHEVMCDVSESSAGARLRAYQLVVALAQSIQERGDAVKDVEVE